MEEITLSVNMAGAAPSKPTDIYHLGQAFYLAGRRCLLNIEVGPGITQCLTSPGVVNLCLAAELFMKALIVSDGKKAPRTHKLDELYSRLSNGDRKAISDMYAKAVPEPTLETLLERAAEYFVKVRYGHEFNVYGYHEYPIMKFADVLYKYCSTRCGQAVGIDRIIV